MKTRFLLALPLLLAGCATPAVAPTTAADGPVSVSNCGFALTVESPPERIVTIKSTSTELLLALGLEQRIIGQAFSDGPIPAELGGAGIPIISDKVPSEEALLALEPDFVFGGWESNFTAEAAGDRAELLSLGIGSYVSPPACTGEHQPAHLSYDDVFAAITEAGAVFGAVDAAAALVEQQRAELAAVPQRTDGLTALWWSSGKDTPFVGAGIGAPQMVLERVGLTNIAAEVDASWAPFGWESVVAADPDVIVLIDASWNTAESKKQYLAANPATAALSAVQNERYLVLPFAAGEAGVRSVAAAKSLAEQLAALY